MAQKNKNKKFVTITMNIEDAETLLGLVDGCVGTSADLHFSRWGRRIIKKLLTEIEKHYPKKNT